VTVEQSMFVGPHDGIRGSQAHEPIDDLDKHLGDDQRWTDEGQPTYVSGCSIYFAETQGKFKLDASGLSSTTKLMKSKSTKASCKRSRTRKNQGAIRESPRCSRRTSFASFIRQRLRGYMMSGDHCNQVSRSPVQVRSLAYAQMRAG
jgi:hypothetical protein